MKHENLKSVTPIILAFVLCTYTLLTLVGCEGSGPGREQSTTTHGDFKVEHLFTHDNVKVYRFTDNGWTRYFTTRGDVISNQGKPSRTFYTVAGPDTTE